MSVIDKFLPMVLDDEDEGVVSPILIHEKVTFVYIKHSNVYCILVLLGLVHKASFPGLGTISARNTNV